MHHAIPASTWLCRNGLFSADKIGSGIIKLHHMKRCQSRPCATKNIPHLKMSADKTEMMVITNKLTSFINLITALMPLASLILLLTGSPPDFLASSPTLCGCNPYSIFCSLSPPKPVPASAA